MSGVNLGSAVGYLDLDTSKFNTGLKSAMNNLDSALKSSESASNRFMAVGSSMQTVGKGLTVGLTVPLATAGGIFVNTAMQFEGAMSKVQSTLMASKDEMVALEDKAMELGASTIFSASEVAEAFNFMAMAGWDTEEMLDGIGATLDLASASGEELGLVSDIVTDGLTALGMSADETGKFCDVLAQTASSSNTNIAMMGETFKYVAPVAGSLGYSLEDVALASGLMANAGIKASQAGTTLRGAMTRVVKPSKEARGAMMDLGLATEDTITVMENADGSAKPFRETLDILRDSFDGLSETQKAQYASTIFGQEAMSGMLAIINASEEDYNSLAESIDNAEGSAKKMSEIKTDNLQGDMKELSSAVEGLALSYRDILLPPIREIVQKFTEIISKISQMDEGKKKLIITIGLLAVAIPPLLLIIGGLIKGFVSLNSTFTMLKPTLGSISKSISSLSLPILAVVAVVAVLVYAWKTDFMGIQETTKKTMEYIELRIKNALTILKSIWFQDLGNIRTITKNVFDGIKIVINTVMTIVVGLITAGLKLIQGDWQGAWDAVKVVLSTTWDAIKKLCKLGIDTIVNIIKGSIELFVTLGKNIVEGIIKGFKSMFNSAVDLAGNLGKAMLNKAKEVLGIQSPSKQFALVGQYINEGLAKGIKDNTGITTSSMEYLAKHVLASGDAISTGLIKQEKSTQKFIYDEKFKTTMASINLYEKDRNNRVKSMTKGTDENIKQLDREISATQKASEMKMKIYEQELRAKMSMIDSSMNDELKALQDQLDAMDEQEKQESRNEKTAQYEDELEALKEKIQLSETEEEYEQLKKELMELNASRQKELLAQQREDERKAIQEKMEEARREAEEAKAKLQEEYEAKQYQLQMQREAELEYLKTMQELLKQDLELRKEIEEIKTKKADLEAKLKNAKLSAWEKKQTKDDLAELKARESQLNKSMNSNMVMLKGYKPTIDSIAKQYGDSLQFGIMSTKDALYEYLDNLYQKAMDVISAMQDASDSVGGSYGSYAGGLDYVPHDGFRATLHEGERVLTAKENEEYNGGRRNSGGGDTFIFNSPKALTPRESARQMKRAKKDLALGF